MADTVEEMEGGIPLRSIADVRRAMAMDAKRMRYGKLDVKLGNALMFAYTQLAHVMQDERDNRYKKQVRVLWEAHQRGRGLPVEEEAEPDTH